MRHILLITAILLLHCTCALAQRTARIDNPYISFDKESMPAMQITLDAGQDEVTERWDEFWDERYDVDVDKRDKDAMGVTYFSEQVNVPLVSSKNFDLYSKIGKGSDRSTVSMAIAFSTQDVATRDTHRQSYEAGEAILQEFYTYFYEKHFGELLEETRDELDDLRDDRQDASKDAEKARKKIEKMERKIEKLREDIEDTRREVGDELETAEEKARRVNELEEKIRELERMRARYL